MNRLKQCSSARDPGASSDAEQFLQSRAYEHNAEAEPQKDRAKSPDVALDIA